MNDIQGELEELTSRGFVSLHLKRKLKQLHPSPLPDVRLNILSANIAFAIEGTLYHAIVPAVH